MLAPPLRWSRASAAPDADACSWRMPSRGGGALRGDASPGSRSSRARTAGCEVLEPRKLRAQRCRPRLSRLRRRVYGGARIDAACSYGQSACERPRELVAPGGASRRRSLLALPRLGRERSSMVFSGLGRLQLGRRERQHPAGPSRAATSNMEGWNGRRAESCRCKAWICRLCGG